MSRLIKYKPRATTTRIILHDTHSVPGIETDWVRTLREGGLKMGLLDIGYHFSILHDGRRIETRDRKLIGTHTPGHNMDSIGIILEGGREPLVDHGVNNFSKVQIANLFDTFWELMEDFGQLDIKGHTEIQKYRNRMLPYCPPIEMDDLRQDWEFYRHNRKVLHEQDSAT